MNRVKVHLFLKSGNTLSNGENPIYARVVVDGERFDLSTKRSVVKKKWDDNRNEVKGRTEYAMTLNHYLSEFKTDILETFNRLKGIHDEVSAQLLNLA